MAIRRMYACWTEGRTAEGEVEAESPNLAARKFSNAHELERGTVVVVRGLRGPRSRYRVGRRPRALQTLGRGRVR